MEKREICDYLVAFNECATRSWYEKSEEWGCDCGHCRNFVTLSRRRELPAPMLKLLDELGVPPEKATYVCAAYPDGAGLCYQISYRMAGNILRGDERKTTMQSWGGVCCWHDPYPYGALDFPDPHFDLEFWVTLPWTPEDWTEGAP